MNDGIKIVSHKCKKCKKDIKVRVPEKIKSFSYNCPQCGKKNKVMDWGQVFVYSLIGFVMFLAIVITAFLFSGVYIPAFFTGLISSPLYMGLMFMVFVAIWIFVAASTWLGI